MIAIGSDHGGYALKQEIMRHLSSRGLAYQDYGCYSEESCDYPVYGKAVAHAVADGTCEKGILICGTGIGISLAANKIHGIRCAVCSDCFSAEMSRRHNNANIIVFPARFISNDEAVAMLDAYFSAQFEGGRHEHRIEKMAIPCCTAGETAK